jgi:hypothetical protein
VGNGDERLRPTLDPGAVLLRGDVVVFRFEPAATKRGSPKLISS